jgi:hypothetical protein
MGPEVAAQKVRVCGIDGRKVYVPTQGICLKSTDVNLSFCLEYQAWLLLYELLIRTTLRNVARLLHAHKFVGTLQNTLQRVHEHAISQGNLADLYTEENMAVADSSSTTIEASSVEEFSKSRKRKRVGSQVRGMQDKIELKYDTGLLYFAICRVVNRLNALVADLHDDSRGFAVEHLKATLKGPANQVAQILGTSLSLAHFLSQKSYLSIANHMCIVDGCINSCIGFWKVCLIAADDPSDQPSNVSRRGIQLRQIAHYRSSGSILGSLSISFSSTSCRHARTTKLSPAKPDKE